MKLSKISTKIESYIDKYAPKNNCNILVLGDISKKQCNGIAKYGLVQVIPKPSSFVPKIINDEIGLPGDLDIRDSSFDLIIVTNWLEKIKWYRWSLQEVHRVLKPEGVLILEFLNAENSVKTHYFTKMGMSIVRKFGRHIGNYFFGKPLMYFPIYPKMPTYTLDSFSEVLVEIDFEMEECQKNSQSILKRVIGRNQLNDDFLVFICKKIEFDISSRKSINDPMWLERSLNRDYKDEFSRFRELQEKYDVHTSQSPKKYVKGDFPKNSLVLSPHPDDEIIGLGGTILRMLEDSCNITVLQMTNGQSSACLEGIEATVKNTVRVREANKVAKNIGVELISWDDVSDDTLNANDSLVLRLVNIIEKTEPDGIFVPFYNDPHQDHFAANEILYEVLKRIKPSNIKIYSYEVWSLCPYNVIVDITDEFERKRNVLSLYRTALRSVNYIRTTEWFSAYHAKKINNELDLVEVFRVMTSTEYTKAIEKYIDKR